MRKSVLLAGYALAVAGLTVGAQKADAAEISLGMYTPFLVGGASSDNTAEDQWGLGTTDAKFYVTGTLENGISVAVKFQFAADGDTATKNTD